MFCTGIIFLILSVGAWSANTYAMELSTESGSLIQSGKEFYTTGNTLVSHTISTTWDQFMQWYHANNTTGVYLKGIVKIKILDFLLLSTGGILVAYFGIRYLMRN